MAPHIRVPYPRAIYHARGTNGPPDHWHIHGMQYMMRLDLDVDSNNDGTINQDDDAMENDPKLPGKIFCLNDGDVNTNGVPDYLELVSTAALTPIELELNTGVPLEDLVIRFLYDAAEPGTTNGALRLWMKNESRSASDFIVPDTNNNWSVAYNPAALGFDKGGQRLTFYMEGIRTGAQSIRVELAYTNTTETVNYQYKNSRQPAMAEDAVRVTLIKVDFQQADNPETLCDNNTLTAVVQPSDLTISSYRFESQQVSGGGWSTITNTTSASVIITPRTPGHFKRRVVAVANGVECTSTEVDVETQFPDNATIAADGTVEGQRAADWTAASGPSGDHNERGGWIYLNTANCTYRTDPWPMGTFFGVNPSVNPSDSGDEYYVGEYQLHATLRDTNDIANATSFPTGPLWPDISASTASDTPGLLRDRHADEIMETGHTDFFYGPTRRTTPP